ncbi:MAG: formimidoylglutamase [Flavobacteriaceae bacterium]
MINDFLQPVEPEVSAFVKGLSPQHFGSRILLHDHLGLPDLGKVQLALVGVADSRGAGRSDSADLIRLRKELYTLFFGNWDCTIADLGNIEQGASLEDTYFALNQTASFLLKKKIVLIVLGGSQDLTYPLYRAYDHSGKMVNLVSVDSRFDFGRADLPVSSDSYLTKIIMEEPNNLLGFSNIGYQVYYNAQEEVDLIEKLFFDAYRLGEVGSDITLVEPVLRDADIVSVDFFSVQSVYTGNFSKFVPNGFTGKEICALARYAGISDRVSVLGLFNTDGNLSSEAVLQSQIIWYFIEGYCCRYKEFPETEINNFLKYIVSLADDEELVFYKSEFSQRWWMQVVYDKAKENKSANFTLLPCRYEDYVEASQGIYPERWWKAQKKYLAIQ